MKDTAPRTVFLDASVLYPASIRSLLLYLAGASLYRPLWSARVHEEWINALLRDRPDLTRQQLDRTRALMEAHAADANVSGYESLIDAITLPDPDDRHVAAAAIHGGASVILTANLRDFPAAALAPYHLTAQHPDAFVVNLLEVDRSAVLAVMRRHRQSLKNPPKTPAEYLATFVKHGLTTTVAALRAVIDRL